MNTKEFLFPLIPKKCPICGINRNKGNYPERFDSDTKVSYKCGSLVSVKQGWSDKNSFSIEVEDCWSLGNLKKSDVTLEFISRNKRLYQTYYPVNMRKLCPPGSNKKVKQNLPESSYSSGYKKIAGNKPFSDRMTYYCAVDISLAHFTFFEFVPSTVRIHYGPGVIPIFTTEQLAKNYVKIAASSNSRNFRYIENKHFVVQALSLGWIYKISISVYSHAVVDPVLTVENIKQAARNYTDNDLTDLTTLGEYFPRP